MHASAHKAKQNKIYEERLNLVEANSIYNSNEDPNLIVEVNAGVLTVSRTGNGNEAVVQGTGDWLVHGTVTLDVDSSGNVIGINTEKYDFNWDDTRSLTRNMLTAAGAGVAEMMRPSANYNGVHVARPRQGGVPYWIEYKGAPNVK